MQPQTLKRAVIKEEFVALTGDFVKSVILNQLIYWSQRVNDFDKFVQEEISRAEYQEGSNYKIELRNGWIYKSADELSAETMLHMARNTTLKHIEYLVKNGWVDRRNNPENKWDRTTQYRVNLLKIHEDLLKLGYVLQDYKIKLPFVLKNNKDTERKSENEPPSSKTEHGGSKNKLASSYKEHASSKNEDASAKFELQSTILESPCYSKELRCSNSEERTSKNGTAIPEITTEITNRDYNPSIHPHKDSIILSDQPDRRTDKNIKQNNNQDLKADILLKQLCETTGATINQLQEAIKRANRMGEEGKIKGNYLKLVESIARTVVKEDLLKNSGSSEEDGKKNTKKEIIKSLYIS